MKGSGLTLNLKYLLFIFLLISLQSCGYNLRESPSFLFNKNIAVIPNGISDAFFNAKDETENFKRKKRMLFLSQIIPVKQEP